MIRVPHAARNGDVHLAADDLGGAGGDPLLLIMGLGVSRFWWPDGLVAALIDAGFSVASFDGHDAGGSRVGLPVEAVRLVALSVLRR